MLKKGKIITKLVSKKILVISKGASLYEALYYLENYSN